VAASAVVLAVDASKRGEYTDIPIP